MALYGDCSGLLLYTLFVTSIVSYALSQSLPFIVTTWPGWETADATLQAWDVLYNEQRDVVESVVEGCSVCDFYNSCASSTGPGGSHDENGEVTQDAMIMDGRTMEVGSVGCLRRIAGAIRVAHAVMKHTKHSMLVGDLATEFAKAMGFVEEYVSGNNGAWLEWRNGSCQPNNWVDVIPDPTTSCGPYSPGGQFVIETLSKALLEDEVYDHDTIGMVAVDVDGNVASGTTTNGKGRKIPGRVGDSPIVGSGSYAENGVGGAAATGDGDVMVKFLPSYHAVHLMSRGSSPMEAAQAAMRRMALHDPTFDGAMVTLNVQGEHGAACVKLNSFPYNYINPETGGLVEASVLCETV